MLILDLGITAPLSGALSLADILECPLDQCAAALSSVMVEGCHYANGHSGGTSEGMGAAGEGTTLHNEGQDCGEHEGAVLEVASDPSSAIKVYGPVFVGLLFGNHLSPPG